MILVIRTNNTQVNGFYIKIVLFFVEFLAVDKCEIHVHLERIDKKDLPKVCNYFLSPSSVYHSLLLFEPR